MMRDARYTHHSLNVFLAEKDVAEEVAAEAGIDIEFKSLLWFGPESPAGDMVGVYCEIEEEASRFKQAFCLRRWEDGRKLRGRGAC